MSKEYFTGQREEARSYSRAVKVRGGTTVYLAGVSNRDAKGNRVIGDFASQARAAFERLRDAIELAGGTLDDIVSMTMFITDCRHGDELVQIRKEYFKPGHYTASAMITVDALASPEMTLELQAIAVLDA